MARWLLALFFVAVLTALGVGAWQQGYLVTPAEELLPGPLRGPLNQPGNDLTPTGILAETNRHRAIDNLPALTPNATLDQAAEKKVADMFAQQYFAHEAPDGTGPSDLVAGVHYEYIRVGENLALGNFSSDEAVVQAWMDSPGHRANILHPGFSELGVAAAQGNFEGTDVWLAVQTFAAPLSSCPSVDPTLQQKFDHLKTQLDSLADELARAHDPLDTEQKELERIAEEIQRLIKSGSAMITAGNEKIEQGNQVYQDTGDKNQAQPYWDEGERLQSEGRTLLEEARRVQADYNTRADKLTSVTASFNQQVKQQNSLSKEMTATTTTLNQQIRVFNDCIK